MGRAVATFHFTNREHQYDGMIACSSGQRLLIIYDDGGSVPAPLRAMKGYQAQFESEKGEVWGSATYFGSSATNPVPSIVFSIPQLNDSSFEGSGLTLVDIKNPTLKPPPENMDLQVRAEKLVPLFLWQDAVNAFLFKIVAENGLKTLPIVFRDCRK